MPFSIMHMGLEGVIDVLMALVGILGFPSAIMVAIALVKWNAHQNQATRVAVGISGFLLGWLFGSAAVFASFNTGSAASFFVSIIAGMLPGVICLGVAMAKGRREQKQFDREWRQYKIERAIWRRAMKKRDEEA